MIKFEKAHPVASNFSSLQGYIDITYAELVDLFGEPHNDGDGYKVDARWELLLSDGYQEDVVVTIYNYKNGYNYTGGDHTRLKQWNVGGFDIRALNMLNTLVRHTYENV